MTDRMSDFELNHVPCEAKDFNTARCRVAPQIIEKIGGIINTPVRIATDSGFVFCTLWPRHDGQDNIVQIDGLVTLPNSKKTNVKNGIFCKKKLSSKDIAITKPADAETIVVSLFLSSSSSNECFHGLNQSARELKEERMVRSILRGCVIMHGCVVQPKECRNVQRPKRIAKILVVSTKPSTQSLEDQPIKVTDKTEINVKSVRSGQILEDDNNKILAGLDDVARELQELLSFPFLYPGAFAQLGLECPKGILLQGAPGVGKTLLVKSVTLQCNVQLITLNGTDVFGPHPGESEENLRKMFETARNASQYGPCVLFIDELDALCPKRGSSVDEQENRIVAQLLTLLDGLESRGQLVIIGATNRPNAIDPALRRPGRLDREVIIGVPNALQRLSILEAHTASLKIAQGVDLAHIAEVTIGYVGADIASLCREAAFISLKRTLGCSYNKGLDISSEWANVEEDRAEVTMADFQLALCHIVPSTYRGLEGMVELHPVNWDDIGGLQDVKLALKQAIEWPLKHPESFARLGLSRPRGVLLYGPPGCCKTTLVRAAATSCQCTFMALSCAQLYSPFVGDAERKLREVFTKARAAAPSVLFLDELDAIVGKRSGNSRTGVESRLLSTLLNEMDGVGVLANIYQSGERNSCNHGNEQLMRRDCESGHLGNEPFSIKTQRLKLISSSAVKDVLIVAATNRPDAIDEALLRPGRIDRIIYVPPPDIEARLQILRVHTRAIPLAEDVDLEELGLSTELFSGADIENLCRESALYALEEGGMTVSKVERKHFMAALSTVKPSLTTTQLKECQMAPRYRDHPKGGYFRFKLLQSDVTAHVTYCLVPPRTSV